MRIIVESGYLWLGASSFEVEPETTVIQLCDKFLEKEDKELEQFVVNRKLLPDDMPDLYPDMQPLSGPGKEWTLRDITLTMKDLGVLHGQKIHAIFDRPLPELKITSESKRDYEKENKYIELGKQALAEEKERERRFDAKECARPLPPGWSRAKGDDKTQKPGSWYYYHEDGTRQWKFPTPVDGATAEGSGVENGELGNGTMG